MNRHLILLVFCLFPGTLLAEETAIQVAKKYWLAWANLDREGVSSLVVEDMASRIRLGVSVVSEKVKTRGEFAEKWQKRTERLKSTMASANCESFAESTICYVPGVYDTNIRLVKVDGVWKVDPSIERQKSDPNWSKVLQTQDSE